MAVERHEHCSIRCCPHRTAPDDRPPAAAPRLRPLPPRACRATLPERLHAAHRHRLGLRRRGRHPGRQHAGPAQLHRQRQPLHDRHAARQPGRHRAERRQHDQFDDGHAADARPLPRAAAHHERHQRRREPGPPRRRRDRARALGDAARGLLEPRRHAARALRRPGRRELPRPEARRGQRQAGAALRRRRAGRRAVHAAELRDEPGARATGRVPLRLRSRPGDARGRPRDHAGARALRPEGLQAWRGRARPEAVRRDAAAPGGRRARRVGHAVPREPGVSHVPVRTAAGRDLRDGDRCARARGPCERRALHRVPQPQRPGRRGRIQRRRRRAVRQRAGRDQ